MKKRRFFLIISFSLIFAFVTLLASPIFKLSKVEIKFLNKKNEVVLLKDNFVFNTEEKVNSLISSAGFDFGQSMFLINKSNYKTQLENKNPYVKLIKISSVFPNKIFIYATEREELFYISSNDKYFILDEDFKILNILKKEHRVEKLEITFLKDNLKVSFFDFFNISSLAFDSGQYLWENNLVFDAIKNFMKIFNELDVLMLGDIDSFLIENNSSGTINLCLGTENDCYGIKLIIKDILKNFDKKFKKLNLAFKTLVENEKIKTAYGCLYIDNNLNCFWNNL